MRLYLGCEAISYKHYAPVAVCWRRTLPTRLYYGRERPEALACATSEAASRLASPRLASFHKVRLSDDQREFWCKTRLDITYKDRGFGHDRCAKIENSFLSE